MVTYSLESVSANHEIARPTGGVKYSCEALEVGPSQEGWGSDILWDGIIGWLLHKDDHKLSEAKGNIEKAIVRVKAADDSKFHRWKFLKQINIFSKYLPDWDKFNPTVSSLKKAIDYLKSIKKPGDFNESKFKQCFTGSIYVKKGEFNPDEVSGTGFWNLFSEDIRVRGWDEKNKFLTALNACKSLIPQTESLVSAKDKVKDDESGTFKEYKKAVETTVKLVGYLCRGTASASNKIGGSIWARLFTTEN